MQTEIKIDEIYWDMDWSRLKSNNPDNERIQQLPDIERKFEEQPAIALMLINEVIFLNDHWWEKDWPEKAKQIPSLNVNCNDVFYWGCADAEEMMYDEIQDVYDHYIKDPGWGTAVWCIKKRNLMPQKPVYDMIQKEGIWNLDEMNLEPNESWPEPKVEVNTIWTKILNIFK